MIRRQTILLIILLIVGCGTEPEDCAGVAECVVGNYSLTTYLHYNTSDCSGEGEDGLPEMIQTIGISSITLILDSNDSVTVSSTGVINKTMTGSWTHSGNQITITINIYVTSEGEEVYDVQETFTFTDNSLIIQVDDDDGWMRTIENCEYMVFTKN